MTVEAISAAGLLRTFSDAGVLEAADMHVAQRLTALVGEADERVALAVALVVRALRGGSVCVDLRKVEAQVGPVGTADLPWPDITNWMAAVAASPLLGSPPVLRLFGDLLYLDRYWLEEEQVCADLLALSVSRGQPNCQATSDFSRRGIPNSGRPPKSRCRRRLPC